MKLLALLLLAVPAAAAEKNVTIVFTGDNTGEVAPCGCSGNPSGGLPRRKTALAAMANENVLLLDSGNALYRNTGAPDSTRAALVFDLMARLGTRAMAVGPRDLATGAEELLKLSSGSPMKVLSANLKLDGKRVFDGGAVFVVGGVKVGVIALTAPGKYGNAEATDLKIAAKEALAALGARDVTVLLAAIPYEDSLTLARELPQVDVMIQSSNERGMTSPQVVDEKPPFIFSSAQRGQALGKLELHVGGKRPFIDLASVDALREKVKTVDGYIAFLRGNTRDVAELKQRKKGYENEIARATNPGVNSFRFSWLTLGTTFADDPEWKSEVLKVEPSYTH